MVRAADVRSMGAALSLTESMFRAYQRRWRRCALNCPAARRPALKMAPEGKPVFQEACAPTIGELRGLLVEIIARLMRMLTRQGCLVEEQGMTYLADIDPDNPLRPLQAAPCTYRVALGPRHKWGRSNFHQPEISHCSTVRSITDRAGRPRLGGRTARSNACSISSVTVRCLTASHD